MKTPKKVIEKISLPLMFVMFVMAVLVFAVSPVSAAPPSQCGTDFCDQDGDDYIREHRKCPDFCPEDPGLGQDLDDNDCSNPILEGCSGSSGGDGTMTTPDVKAWWSGAVNDGSIAAARECEGSGNEGNGGVSYGCIHSLIWPVTVGGATGEWTPTTEPLCSDLQSNGLVLDGSNATPIGPSNITTGYFFLMDPTLNDTACVAGADCLVSVDIWAYFDEWCTSNFKKCGRLVIVQGWVIATPADDGDLNPFKYDQLELPVFDLTVTFKGIGTNRTMATCLYNGSDTFFNTKVVTIQ